MRRAKETLNRKCPRGKAKCGLFGVPVKGPQRGHIGPFFCSVIDSEVYGPEFTPDYKTHSRQVGSRKAECSDSFDESPAREQD